MSTLDAVGDLRGSSAETALSPRDQAGALDTTPKDLAVIIPAFNEEGGIRSTVEKVQTVLSGMACRSELVVVDDGSSDQTAAEAHAAGARVIAHPHNKGYGAALKTGILGTKAHNILIIDADCTYPPEAIPRLWAKMDRYDMAVGSRPITSSGITWARRPAKWFLNKLASYLVGQHIPDLNSGQRIMRRTVVLHFLPLLPMGFSFTSTITMAMLANGYPVAYEPIEYTVRTGTSKIRPQDFGNFILLVVRAIVLFNPLKVFLPAGAALFLIGVGKLVEDIYLMNLSETAVMVFLSAIVVWSVGLLADMIARLQLTRGPQA
ncbi:MAG TPA: glycosyltransferase family 2 protein [Vicinamibacterales bacterium]|nr:glycosyltransferase family 2 protein [Vicinamibacterales bacterium]